MGTTTPGAFQDENQDADFGLGMILLRAPQGSPTRGLIKICSPSAVIWGEQYGPESHSSYSQNRELLGQ